MLHQLRHNLTARTKSPEPAEYKRAGAHSAGENLKAS